MYCERTVTIYERSSEDSSSDENDKKASSSGIFEESLSNKRFSEASFCRIYKRRNDEEFSSRLIFERLERTFGDSSHE